MVFEGPENETETVCQCAPKNLQNLRNRAFSNKMKGNVILRRINALLTLSAVVRIYVKSI